MAMTFNVRDYWLERGKNYRFESRLQDPFYADQAQFVADVIEWMYPELPPRILEVGCGFGRITKILNGRSIDACDISPDQLAAARETCQHVNFFEADLTDALGRGEWDLIVAIEVLLHQPEDVVRAFIRSATCKAERVLHDWDPMATTAAEHCWVHDYPAIYESMGLKVNQYLRGPHALLCVHS